MSRKNIITIILALAALTVGAQMDYYWLRGRVHDNFTAAGSTGGRRMRHHLIVLLLIAAQSMQAQISHDFRNTPLTEALRAIEQGQEEYTIVMAA